MSEFVERAWGGYRVIAETEKTLIKELVFKGGFVRPQRHQHRAEHWQLIEGKITGYVQTQDDEKPKPVHLFEPGDTTIIPLGAWHWFGGVGTVMETWYGHKFSEADIEVRGEL